MNKYSSILLQTASVLFPWVLLKQRQSVYTIAANIGIRLNITWGFQIKHCQIRITKGLAATWLGVNVTVAPDRGNAPRQIAFIPSKTADSYYLGAKIMWCYVLIQFACCHCHNDFIYYVGSPAEFLSWHQAYPLGLLLSLPRPRWYGTRIWIATWLACIRFRIKSTHQWCSTWTPH